MNATSEILYDTKPAIGAANGKNILSRIPNLSYTGAILYPEFLDESAPLLGSHLKLFMHAENGDQLRTISTGFSSGSKKPVVTGIDVKLLGEAREAGFSTALRSRVSDAGTLHSSIELGAKHDYLMVSFLDPTNIPLELIIATLQPSNTVLIKEIVDPTNVDDAIVSLGVMEVGADGVLFSPLEHTVLDNFVSRLEKLDGAVLPLQTGTVVKSIPVGMGYRSCIDLATLFSPEEGMIIGSTSQGGILCCPEVFFLPYMELRPFRVNAGGVHSYVYNFNNRTDYMTELRAGSSAMIVDKNGRQRKATVGRMKTEMRPLRLIEVEFENKERVNVILQDDWHVRVYSPEMKPLNITDLKPGDKVKGYVAQPGRHVGIKVDEHILEN